MSDAKQITDDTPDSGFTVGHWNHRIVRHRLSGPALESARQYDIGEFYFAIHEVYYDDDKNVIGITEEPVEISSTEHKTIKEGIESLKWILAKVSECMDHPVLDYDTRKEVKD